jgi:hypothetical protein
MSSGFKQVLLANNLTTYVVATLLQDLCLTQQALTWYLALPSDGFIQFVEFVEFIELFEFIETGHTIEFIEFIGFVEFIELLEFIGTGDTIETGRDTVEIRSKSK